MFLYFHPNMSMCILIIIDVVIVSFSRKRQFIVFHWSIGDSMYPWVSRTLLSILVDLNNAVVCMVFIRSSISNASNSVSLFWGTVPSALITIGISVTLMFHNFLSSPPRSM